MPQKRFPYYPIFVDLEDRDVLIVGGGAVATRKTESILRHGARVTVIAPQVSDEIERWEREGRLATRRRAYGGDDLDGPVLVIAATGDLGVNTRVADDCRRRGIPVNVVDEPALGTFVVPALVERGSIQIAVSTGGSSPAMARRLRRDLESTIGPEYGKLNDLLGSLRVQAKASLPAEGDRRRFFEAILDSDALDLIRQNQRRAAHDCLERICAEAGVPVSAEVEKLGNGE